MTHEYPWYVTSRPGWREPSLGILTDEAGNPLFDERGVELTLMLRHAVRQLSLEIMKMADTQAAQLAMVASKLSGDVMAMASAMTDLAARVKALEDKAIPADPGVTIAAEVVADLIATEAKFSGLIAGMSGMAAPITMPVETHAAAVDAPVVAAEPVPAA